MHYRTSRARDLEPAYSNKTEREISTPAGSLRDTSRRGGLGMNVLVFGAELNWWQSERRASRASADALDGLE